ncbi:predicted protein [Meyerozyma guilliermondii ATCC 6260]|uniref:Uncharacterized protein n=1 Tax=Meyerozyma guilliermondii (strain ATCC 6260 / CBS 566 / DSM 6381 / JCM 1539 / NBRC 10279 / NRRL Y-324) TaxID=294746 RepID=A5DIC7_PICGU|nr:uncharacterized protein PGUG_03028 [Meyerozyma guilliermondii ATCC 6260]EDK38930.2 predicted protein [Meyerozyma guilliermondii ATCC 6260]
MSRRNEIKQKQAIQAQIQLAFSNSEKKAASWLAPSTKNTESNSSYLDLPIVPPGAGLSSLEDSPGNIRDFIESDTTKPDKWRPSKPHQQTKAMAALTNKMRSEKRDKIHKRLSTKPAKPVKREDSDSESDEDRKIRSSRSVKKSNKSKRPF